MKKCEREEAGEEERTKTKKVGADSNFNKTDKNKF